MGRAAHLPLRIDETDEPLAADAAVVDAGLDAYNHAASDLNAIRHMACFARTCDGEIAGGAVGRRWGAAAEMQQIWVREDLRRSGIGARLVRAFEDLARRRGCDLLYLDTFTFQAPAFYARLGFTVACELPGFPGGSSKLILTKRLG